MSNGDQKDPAFWSYFETRTQPQKNPAALLSQRPPSSSSSSSTSDSEDDDMDVVVPPSGAVKQPRFFKHPRQQQATHARSVALKQTLQQMFELRSKTRARREQLEDAESDLQQRCDALAHAETKFHHYDRQPLPLRICVTTPLLARILATDQHATLEPQQLSCLLRHYDARHIAVQLAQGRLRLLSGRFTAAVGVDYLFVLGLSNQEQHTKEPGVIFYIIHRV